MLDKLFHLCNITDVEWIVEFTAEFERWGETLLEGEQEAIDVKVHLLERHGPALRRPHSGNIRGSKHAHMKELIVQYAGEPYHVLYAFDPRRCAILLIGGKKTGNENWYEEHMPTADRIFDEHLAAINSGTERKGEGNGKEF